MSMCSRFRPWTCGIAGIALISGCQRPANTTDGQSPAAATGQDTASAPDPLPDIRVVSPDEFRLVEDVLSHRAAYHRTLRQLRDFYAQHGSDVKRDWAAFELQGFEQVKPYAYIEEGDIPVQSLHATESIPAADALYDRGLDLMRRGGHGVPVLFQPSILADAYRALLAMIRKYPSSDKIDDAAFQCGELVKEYFPGQEALAAAWFQRAYTWNPDTTFPARFRAAVLLDYRLHDRDAALTLYREIVARDAGDRSNVRYARGRIDELTAASSPAESPDDSDTAALFGSPPQK